MVDQSVGVIIIRQYRSTIQFLLLRKKVDKMWDFPKGHSEHYEKSEEATARRELREETGIQNIAMIPGFREVIEFTNPQGIKRSLIFFLATVDPTSSITLSPEHNLFRWCSLKRAMQMVSFPERRHILKCAANFFASYARKDAKQ